MRAGNVRAILSLCDEFTPGETPEFFFDRNPDNFPAILNLYRTGKLHATERGCALVLQQDLQVRPPGETSRSETEGGLFWGFLWLSLTFGKLITLTCIILPLSVSTGLWTT